MAVERSAKLLRMYQYAASSALVPSKEHFTKAEALGKVAPWPPTVSEWAFVPTFQRGIAWGREKVDQLIDTSSEKLGEREFPTTRNRLSNGSSAMASG